MVLIKIANVQEVIIIDKSYKWFHAWKFLQMVSYFYTWYFYKWYLSCKTMVPQVILNFKWSNQEMLPSPSSGISSGLTHALT
jgi:hypothetical protein